MKGLHKKIGIGVLVSGLLIGGISLASGSVSYASSNISLGLEIKDLLDGIGVELPPELKAFLNGGHKGLLDYDSKSSLRPKLSKSKMEHKYKDFFGSILAYSERNDYSVIGFKLGKEYYSISNYEKYWKSEHSKHRRINLNKFYNAAKKGKYEFKKLGLSGIEIYNVQLDNKASVLIYMF